MVVRRLFYRRFGRREAVLVLRFCRSCRAWASAVYIRCDRRSGGVHESWSSHFNGGPRLVVELIELAQLDFKAWLADTLIVRARLLHLERFEFWNALHLNLFRGLLRRSIDWMDLSMLVWVWKRTYHWLWDWAFCRSELIWYMVRVGSGDNVGDEQILSVEFARLFWVNGGEIERAWLLALSFWGQLKLVSIDFCLV